MCRLQRPYNEIQNIDRNLSNDEQQFIDTFGALITSYSSSDITADEMIMSIHRVLNLPCRILYTEHIFNVDAIQEEPDLKLDLVGLEFDDLEYGQYVVDPTDLVHSGVKLVLLGANNVCHQSQWSLTYSDLLRYYLCRECHSNPSEFIIHVIIEDDDDIHLLRIVLAVNPNSMGVCDTCLIGHVSDMYAKILEYRFDTQLLIDDTV